MSVTSLARADRDRVATPIEEIGENVTAPADLCGSPESSQGSDVWRLHGMAEEPGEPARTWNGLAIDASGITALTVDATRAGLDLRAPVAIQWTSYEPLELTIGSTTIRLAAGTDNRTVTFRP